MSDIVLTEVAKHYGKTVAVQSLSLTIASGELVSLLGPSGCGKTTTLRMIGGFVPLSSGRIAVGGRDVSDLPPRKRNMGFVFQAYALFPHMTVAQNVAFGLQMRRVAPDDSARKVRQALDRVRLSAYADRYPRQMSGGQQQRVALARALVIEPDVLLLDEPLSNLDAALRQEMKLEIRRLQQSLGLTTIFVTHDQDEAMSMSDRMVLMHRGRVEQAGPPSEVYARPRSAFAANFLGVSNLLSGRATPDGMAFELANGSVVRLAGQRAQGRSCVFALRGEELALSAENAPNGANALRAKVRMSSFHGSVIDYHLEVGTGLDLTCRVPAPSVGGPDMIDSGATVTAWWRPEAGLLVSANDH